MKKITLIILLIFLFGCDIMKRAQKSKDQSQYTERITTETIRKGDTITYTVFTPIFKDTIIKSTNRITGTTLTMKYDQQGKLDLECITAEINELKQELRNSNIDRVDKEREKEATFDNTIVIYIVLGVALLFIIGLIFLGIMIKNYAGGINNILNELPTNAKGDGLGFKG